MKTPSTAVLGLILGLMGIAGSADGEPDAGALKGPCQGLMARDYPPPAGFPFLDNVVVQVTWYDLEPAEGRFDGPGWEKIEQAHRQGFKIRLRILAGIHAPDFVKRLGGPGIAAPEHAIDCSQSGGIAVWNPHGERGGCIPRFWLPKCSTVMSG